MAKDRTRFVCQACGAPHPKWQGRCDACGEWNTLSEETSEARGPGPAAKAGGGRRVEFVGLKGRSAPPQRILTGIAELDRVLGGGMVPASAVLVGGDPGIGKSTILLQAAARIASSGRRALYISGEEAVEQVRLRAARLGLTDSPLGLAAATSLRDIVASLEGETDVALVIIDSIQTVWLDALDSAPGTVSQVRSCAAELIRLAKARGFAIVLVGHVTKEGTLAGPRVLEHMVDATLYFEGDRGHQFRILRAVKNRYGATDEIGVFEMTERGLVEVANPSALFLAERRGNVSGSAVFAGIEGTRPVLVEVQCCSPPVPRHAARRQVQGWDAAAGDAAGGAGGALRSRPMNDVYLNVAAACGSASRPPTSRWPPPWRARRPTARPTRARSISGGPASSGEVRQVAQAEARLREAGSWASPRRRCRGGVGGRNAGRCRCRDEAREIGHLSTCGGLRGEG